MTENTLLLGDEMIWSAQRHFRWQIPVLLSTERTRDDNRAKWKLFHAHGNIPPTLPALNNELFSNLHHHSKRENSKTVKRHSA